MATITCASMDILLEQEELLRYPSSFGAREALSLGNTVARLSTEYERGITVEIFRESDGMVLFAWSADDKAPRNYGFIAGKRAAALESGHASPYKQIQVISEGGDPETLWTDPASAPAAGAFPIRVGEEWVATIVVSGLHHGQDHEVCVRALASELNVEVPAITEELA